MHTRVISSLHNVASGVRDQPRAQRVLWLLAGLAVSTAPGPALGYNSEEHKLVGELGISMVHPDSSIVLPSGVAFRKLSTEDDLQDYIDAKVLAVGFGHNHPEESSRETRRVQDNSYGTGYAQRGDPNKPYAGNLWSWIPDPEYLVSTRLEVSAGHVWDNRYFSFGQLTALYGDYRKTTYCEYDTCFLTDASTPVIGFERGADSKGLFRSRRGFRPKPVSGDVYLRAVASGLWPPFGALGNTFGNTAEDDEYDDAGWWGDEMLRIASINDWHFSTAAAAWYVGMHRLALYYVSRAVDDPAYWVPALHYEANAMHSYIDLFALGHMLTHRGATARGTMREEGYRHVASDTYQWLQHGLGLGGAKRSSERCADSPRHRCHHVDIPVANLTLPAVSEPRHDRNDFLPSYAQGTWMLWQVREQGFHADFNQSGACVRNLKGDRFLVFGDGRLRHMTDESALEAEKRCGDKTEPGVWVMARGVAASVQSLFDAYLALRAGESDLAELASAGSEAFAALRLLPVFVGPQTRTVPWNHPDTPYLDQFLGRWVTYAGALEAISGSTVLNAKWRQCTIPPLFGGSKMPAPDDQPCQRFPGSSQTRLQISALVHLLQSFHAEAGSDH